MKRYYETVVKYDKMNDDGLISKATELYLLESESCTDAEAAIVKHLTPYVSGDLEVTSVKLSKYLEYIPEDEVVLLVDGEKKRILKENSRASSSADKYFGVKLSFITLDERSGKEKKQAFYYLVFASSVEAANDTVVLFMKDTVSDYEINNIVETKIVELVER